MTSDITQHKTAASAHLTDSTAVSACTLGRSNQQHRQSPCGFHPTVREELRTRETESSQQPQCWEPAPSPAEFPNETPALADTLIVTSETLSRGPS